MRKEAVYPKTATRMELKGKPAMLLIVPESK